MNVIDYQVKFVITIQVLQFENQQGRKKFLHKLETFLSGRKKTLEMIQMCREAMLANAETKEKRQKRLEHFFREAYALVNMNALS